MSELRLLIVEDNVDELETCRRTIRRHSVEIGREIELVECGDVNEAIALLDNTFDGAIIDIRLSLSGLGDEGNEIIRKIEEGFFRIPVAVLTGTPDSVDCSKCIGVFKKGDRGAGYDDLVDRFFAIYDTGLTRILGGRGTIESKLGQVFLNNLLPQIGTWEAYADSYPCRTENALLRHTLNHLIQLIDTEIVECFPEEFYLYPPVSEEIRAGSILEEIDSGINYVVLSPDCDLVLRRSGKRNTDNILIVEIVPPTALFPWYDRNMLSSLSNNKKNSLTDALQNRRGNHYHCLPETAFFPLGFLNFRSLTAYKEEDLDERFSTPPKLQISPPFVKDIVSRFSSYYARQGQPDIDFDDFVTP